MKSKALNLNALSLAAFIATIFFLGVTTRSFAQTKQSTPAGPTAGKPNILVIFGDDIGQTNLSAYSFGLMDIEHPTSIASPRKA
jgi:arylsulfatase